MNQISLALQTNTDLGTLVTNCKTMTGAITLCVKASGLDDKEIYIPLGIDKGNWSRMMSGHAAFPPDKLNALCDICGNEIPLHWWAWSRSKGLHPLESEQDRKMRELEEKLRKAEEKAEILAGVLQGRA